MQTEKDTARIQSKTRPLKKKNLSNEPVQELKETRRENIETDSFIEGITSINVNAI